MHANLSKEEKHAKLYKFISFYTCLTLRSTSKLVFTIWPAIREKGLSDVCVKRHFRSACAVRAG